MNVFRWSEETLDHIEQHGVTREEFERTVNDPDDVDLSRTSGRPLARRWFGDRWIIAIYEIDSHGDTWPVTAFVRWHE